MSDDFVRITELIGEMSWGIDIPSPIVIAYCDISGDIKTKSCYPKEMEPVFDAIYNKLKTAKEYAPMPQLRKENSELRERIQQLETKAAALYTLAERTCGDGCHCMKENNEKCALLENHK